MDDTIPHHLIRGVDDCIQRNAAYSFFHVSDVVVGNLVMVRVCDGYSDKDGVSIQETLFKEHLTFLTFIDEIVK